MSKLRTTTAARETKSKTTANSTVPIVKKSTISASGPNAASNVKPTAKKPDSEPKTKSTKSSGEKNLRTDLHATRASIPPKTRPKPLASKPSNEQIGLLKRQKPEGRTSSPIVHAKNTSRNVPKNANLSTKPPKPNVVLDTFHNVTVSSPPPRRRKNEPVEEKKSVELPNSTQSTEKRPRTRTHTLDQDEIVVLRNESAKQRSQAAIQGPATASAAPVKDAIAFEVTFEEPPKQRRRSRDTSKARTNATQQNSSSSEDSEVPYSDDFESYESDFETGSSPTVSTENEDNQDDEEESEAENEDDGADMMAQEDDEDEDESELTQNPITVIQRDKELERKLDSGNYEMHSSKRGKSAELTQQFDSLDNFSNTNSEQLDSGISTYGNVAKQLEKKSQNYAVFYGGFAGFNSRTEWSRRDMDLMSKIQFDTLNFTLFEMKPMSYDIFMQTYGNLNTTQSSVQTNDNRMSTEIQTDGYEVRSIWTQHPAQFDRQTVQTLSAAVLGRSTAQNCCGEFEERDTPSTLSKKDELDEALWNLHDFRRSARNSIRQRSGLQKTINVERLNAFLLSSSSLMLNVLALGCSERYLEKELRPTDGTFSMISRGYSRLNTKLLDALRVVNVFANLRHSLVITVHESLPDADVYRSDFSNLLMVWSTSDEYSKPIRLLSSWSEVCRAEICNEAPDIVVCGLRDGSVAMWDLRETYSFCSKLDGYLRHFAATQSIVPMWNASDNKAEKLFDMGAIIDVRSFRSRPKSVGISSTERYKSIQFATLNETGILVIWTIVETTPNEHALDIVPTAKGSRKIRTPRSPQTRFEYSSPWARIKLIQSAICDIRTYLERDLLKPQSSFDRTKYLFEKNVYSDEILREINETQISVVHGTHGERHLQGLRCTCIDTGCESVFVCTNRNFILICSKTLKAEKFRKIAISEERFLFPTALRALTNEDFLAVGLSNGSVMILKCNHNTMKARKAILANENSPPKKEKPHSRDIDFETGKSCAIQNIILNEKRSSDYEAMTDYQPDYETRPSTAACISLISNQKKPFELRIFDQQTILSGSMLRKHLIQSLEISSDGWRLFALSDGEVRIYDFCLDREITPNEATEGGEENPRVIDIAVARSSQRLQHLIVLNENSNVHVHSLLQ